MLVVGILALGFARIAIARRARRNRDPQQIAAQEARLREHPVLWAARFLVLGAAIGALEAFRFSHRPSVARVITMVAIFTVVGGFAGALQIKHARTGVMSQQELLPRLDDRRGRRRNS